MIKKHKDALAIIKNAERCGIVRDPDSYSFITQYPPPLSLPEVPVPLLQILQANVWSMDEVLHLYDHSPSCTGKCKSCTFDTIPNPTKEKIEMIQRAKRIEFDMYLRYSRLGERLISSVYFGGGTPSFPPAYIIGGQLGYYKEKGRFSNDCEITQEFSPETITQGNKNKPRESYSFGVNRASIGFQDLDDKILKALKRRHTAKQAIEAYENIRQGGFEKVNIDLMYGLMGQTIKGWNNTIERVLKLKPEYITLYNYRREGLIRKDFPTKEKTFKMYLEALDAIISAGYIQIAQDQFALPGVEFRHQTETWLTGNEFLGLGNRAYSYFNGWTYLNYGLNSYLNEIFSGDCPIWIGKDIHCEQEVQKRSTVRRVYNLMLTGGERRQIKEWLAIEADKGLTYVMNEELIRRNVIFGLKTSGINNPNSGLDLELFESRFGYTVFEFPVLWNQLKFIRDIGLLEVDAKHTRLTLPGLVIAEEICRELYSDDVKLKLDNIGDKFGRGGL